MELAVTFTQLALAGLFVGVCAGLLGIGGGMLIIPLLNVVFGFDAHAASATSLFTVVPTSISGAISHLRNKTCYLKLGIVLGIGGAVTSTLGVYLGSISPTWAIILVTAAIIFYSAFTMLSKAGKSPRSQGRGALPSSDVGHSAEPQAQDAPFVLTRGTLLAGFGIGIATGLCAGYVGLGGGFIMVPLMTAWLGVPMKKASGTSMIAIIILAIPGVVGQMILGNVDYLAGVMLSVGSIPGAFMGAKLVQKVNDRQLRFLFAGFLLLAGVLLLGKEFGALL